MAASGSQTIQLYYSTTSGAAPTNTNLANGELAININDGKLYYKDSGGTVQTLATKGTAAIGGSNTQVQYNNGGSLAGSGNLTFDGTTLTAGGLSGPLNGTVGTTTPNTGAFTTLSASSTVSGTGFSTYLASPPAIGGTTPAAGSFTTLSASGNITVSGGTANGVLYLNGSKVATSGSALTFDGSALSASGNITSGGVLQALTTVQSSSGADLSLNANGLNRDIIYKVNATELMRLVGSTGNLGIGTSSPSAQLQLNKSGTSDYTTFRLSNSGASGKTYEIGVGGNASAAGYANNLYFYDSTAGSLRMVLDSSGNLGIGTSSPGVKLDVIGTQNISGAASGSATGTLIVKGAQSNSNGLSLTQNSGTDTSSIFNFYSGPLLFGTNNTERMRLDSSGNLLVGTTTAASGASIGLSVVKGGGLQFGGATGGGGALVGNSGGGIQFYGYAGAQGSEGYTERMRLDSSGNLGLGVTPSAWVSGSVSQTISNAVVARRNNGASVFGHNFYESAANTFTYTQTGVATRIEAPTAGGLTFNTAPSGTGGTAITFTQAMTLDASGNLGLGLTNPSAYGGFVTSYAGIGLHANSTSGAAGLNLYESGTGRFSLRTLNGSAGLSFYDSFNGAERMRIDSSGNVVVGNTSANGKFATYSGDNGKVVSGFSSIASGYTDAIFVSEFTGYSPNTTGPRFLYCGDTTATRLTIRSNGGIANYQANDVNLSDRREKTNFAPAGNYLAKICAIPVQTFNYIDQAEDDAGLTLGVVAQDVQAVAPELVMESNWGTEEEPKMRLSIYQTDLQYALMKCIQEQQAIIEKLKARLDAANL